MAQPASRDRERLWTLVAVLFATVVYALSVPLALLAAVIAAFVMSPLGYDRLAWPAAWAYLGGALSYAVLGGAAVIAAGVFYRRRRHLACLVVLFVPLVGPLLAFVAWHDLGLEW